MFNYKNVKSFIRRTRNFGIFLPLSNLVINKGRNHLSSNFLNKLSEKRNKKIQEVLIQSLGNLDFKIKESEKSYDTYKKAPIWWCWFQGIDNLPLIPSLCLKSLQKHANGHPVNIITMDNILNYVSFDKNIIEKLDKRIISYAHFSDILRMSLVKQYGGLWIDSTVYVTKDLPNEIFSRELFTIKTKPFGYFVSQCRWTGFCFAGHKNSPLATGCSDLFEKYWKTHNVLIDYFMIDQTIDILYKNSVIVRKMIDDVADNNPCVHHLNKLLNSEYSATNFSKMTADTYLFKLNWRTYSNEELLANSNNYYHHLLNLIKE